MKTICIILSILCLGLLSSPAAFAQSCASEQSYFHKSYPAGPYLSQLKSNAEGQLWTIDQNIIYKLDAHGELLWQKELGLEDGWSLGYHGSTIGSKKNGGCLVAMSAINKSGTLVFILSINENGTVLWTKRFAESDLIFAANDLSILQLSNNNIFLSGATISPNSTGRGFYNLLLSSKGDLLAKNYLQNEYDLVSSKDGSVIETRDGHILMEGWHQLDAYPLQRWPVLIKMTISGEPVWIRRYPFHANSIAFAEAPDGNILLAASESSSEECKVLNLDTEGKIIWSKELTNVDMDLFPAALIPDDRNNFYLALSDLNGDTATDFLLAKFSMAGELFYLNGYGEEQVREITNGALLTEHDELLLFGWVSGAATGAKLVKTCPADFLQECYTKEYDAELSTAIVSVQSLSSVSKALEGGTFQDDQLLELPTTSVEQLDLCALPTNIKDLTDGINIDYFPNPTSGQINFSSTSVFSNATLSVYSQLGDLLQSQKANSLNGQIDLSDLPSGIYFISIQSNHNRITRKILKN